MFCFRVLIAIFLLALFVPSAQAGWLDTIFGKGSNPEKVFTEQVDAAKVLPSKFDLKSEVHWAALTIEQQKTLQSEQIHINRIYRTSIKDGVIDEWEQLLLDRAMDHARKEVSELAED